MSRKHIPIEQKASEGAFVKRQFELLQKERPELTQELFAQELGLTQGLVGQWFSGKTNIPDKRLLSLGGALNFDPFELRPSLRDYFAAPPSTNRRALLIENITKRLHQADDKEFDRLSRMIAAYLGEDDAPR